jgi:hypothetical protein
VAGDWIKMRGNLWDDPRVSRLCDLCDCGEAQVIGGLYWLWATADQHTEDGIMPGLSLRRIDQKTGVKGLGAALCEIGWVADHPDGVRIVKFEEHNGASAKKRCQTAKRVANHKAGNAQQDEDHQEGNAHSVTSALPREEKSREEKKEDTSTGNMLGAADAARTDSPVVVTPEADKPPAHPKAHPLPDDWQLPRTWGEWALAEYPHWTADVVRLEADKFRDHWRGKSGKDARKADWPATWRNWCRSDICQRSHPLPTASRTAGHTDNKHAGAAAAIFEGATHV